MASKFILASLLGLAVAQTTTTINIPWIGGDAMDNPMLKMNAAIISANPSATTISLACIPDEDCGLFPAETLVVGPSTYNIDMSDPNTDFTATMDCVIAASAVCKETAGGSEANFPGSSTTTYDAESVATYALTVTAGAEKLSAKVTGSLASVTSVASSGTASGTASGTVSGTVSGTRSVSQSGSAPSATHTGAAAGNAIMGGGFLGVAAGLLGGLLL
ncbi:hypothetical protein EJ02DRAFT_339139 [Clathrospora elynae]|uniref:GPI anchored protein n=1 Tax=Clathrospora elynae TaxID=706981 RepID=A0A6A5SX12_9PLEO|nr:hypothetical protein EJ02DRAFT_339139 [Clathrospora elynae]